MKRARKIAVGSMPTPKEDYSDYEEVEILWGRICLLFGLVFAAAFGVIYTLFNQVNDAPAVVSVLEQRRVPALASEQENKAKEQTLSPVVASYEVRASSSEPKHVAKDLSLTTEPQPEPTVTPRAVSVGNEPAGLISPVTTLHPSITHATLTSDINAKKRPVDELGYEVDMGQENLIKVVLYTEMQNIKGTTLYHDWTLGDKTHARVRIPVNKMEQASFSSKYIDKHMTGEWSVKVSDDSGELYAMASFKVQR